MTGWIRIYIGQNPIRSWSE